MTHRMPMNFSYTQMGPSGWKFYGTDKNYSSTMDAVIAGKRTSTLRKGLPRALKEGEGVLMYDTSGREQLVIVTGRRFVDSSMVDQLSSTELWRTDFLEWYMNKNGLEGGKMEQLLYSLSKS